MQEKTSYSPEEVAKMCKSYRLVCGGFDGPVHAERITKYEKNVPENVRDVIDHLNDLEEKALEID